MTQDEIIRMAREAGLITNSFGDIHGDIYHIELFAALVAEAEGKRLVWACEQARDPDKSDEWLRGFDACAAVLNAERIET
jgi:hypothetical protein